MPPYGAKMGPEVGSTQVNATEALLLPGPGLKIEEALPPHGAKMALTLYSSLRATSRREQAAPRVLRARACIL